MEAATRRPAAAPPLLEVTGLVKHFRMRQSLARRLAGKPVPIVHALNGVSFRAEDGRITGLL